MQRRYYTLRDIADIYGMSIDTLRAWTRNGSLPSVKVGRRYMVAVETIAERFGELRDGGQDERL